MAATYYAQILNGWRWKAISDGMDKIAQEYREAVPEVSGITLTDYSYEGKAFDISFWAGKDEYTEDGDFIVSVYIGRSFHLAPSGKYYVPWSTNVTAKEADADTRYWEAFEKVTDKFKMYAISGEGDPTDVFLRRMYNVAS